ncbi:PAS domain-containing protein [Sneathiella marina]|uniref:PAS domain-containing protein n=1 Tax=Sneathiella marina TaxID=2950108 RepID=A0ABY4W7Q8_9PROT|nr:PAS domain-containing protein [Sneathiella marina]USG62934.1 PAS domain-containing protein [Sneathiella marina]
MILQRFLPHRKKIELRPTAIPASELSYSDASGNMGSHKSALTHWQNARKEHLLPSRSDFDLAVLAPILPNIVLLDVIENPLDFRYRVIGNVAMQNFTKNYTGISMSEIPGKGPDSAVFSSLKTVVQSKEPCAQNIPYVGPNHDFKKISSLALPLAKDHVNVDKIMIIVEFLRIQPCDKLT